MSTNRGTLMPMNPVEAVSAGRDLMPAERQQEIVRKASVLRIVKVSDLAAEFGVHEMTIRRDLEVLAEQGLVERIHGGARMLEQSGLEASFLLRASSNVAEKAAIAQAALALVHEGDTVAFDASTSALAVVRGLAGRNVNAIVLSLDAAEELARTDVPFVLVGGSFHPPARSFVGPLAGRQLDRLHPDTVFLSAKGFSARSGFTDAHLSEVETKERLIEAASVVVVLLDHSKFGREALGTFAGADEVHIVVTDREPEEGFRTALERAGVRLIVAGEE